MRRLDDLGDRLNGYVTYEMSDGRLARFDERQVQKHGIEALLAEAGIKIPTGRVPVRQSGRVVGSVALTFDPSSAKSHSFFYDLRPGDFVRDDEGWAASRMLGPGDLSAVPSFQWDDDPQRAERDMEEDRDVLREVLFGKRYERARD